MIPFALKQAWFWLALAGLVACWGTLMFAGRKFGGLWGRLYYCVFVTLLEGMFCFGMIWHMDPNRMPHNFCIAQVISFSVASYALTGLCASFALACALAVFNPTAVNTGRAVLAWHPRYILLVVFFPSVACIAHSTLLVTLDAVQPSMSDDLHCDATSPIWMRLLGYAGLPLIVSIPFLVLSILTALRLVRMTCHGIESTERDEPDLTSTYSLEGPDQKRHNHLSLGAFLPYPTKSRFRGSSTNLATSTVVSPYKDEFPLHRHPFPPVDPVTGKPYSPSLEDRDAASFTFIAASLKTTNSHLQAHSHDVTNNPRNLPLHERHMRSNSGTPDSAVSSTMPVFATNPLLPSMKALATVASSRSSLHSRTGGDGSDIQIGVAITTDESPSELQHQADAMQEESDIVGLAVTTDEPDPRTPTPTLRLRTPSPLPRASVSPSDTQIVQDGPRPQESSRSHPFTPDSGFGLALEDRTRSSESITRTLPSPDHPLRALARANHSAPHALSSPGRSASQAPHQRQASFVSSATFYSAPYPFPDREDRDLLPFSPASASSVQSPMTPKDMEIDLIPHDRELQHQGTEDRNQDATDVKDVDWEDDEYDHHVQMPLRAVQRRDPRDRLGVYNPTPPTPTAIMLEQRRQKLKKRLQQTDRVRARGLGTAIWRMILFQIAFFSVQLLASLSSIIDVARHSITPFGTQHVALLLAAWGPLFIFAPWPKLASRVWKRKP